MSHAVWAPIVYGRTRRVDSWWRTLPAGLDRDFANDVVRAATAGGRALERGPRLVLAQARRARIVGGVCLASELSDTMHRDEINRPLYCFVGWAALERETPPDVPSIDELTQGFADWARPVYEHWMGLDWDLHESQVTGPHTSEPQPPPWGASAQTPPQIGLEPESPPWRQTVAWPREQAAEPWNLLRARRRPGLVVSGWQRLADADVPAGTWIVCDEVTHQRVLDTPASESWLERGSRGARSQPPPPVREDDGRDDEEGDRRSRRRSRTGRSAPRARANSRAPERQPSHAREGAAGRRAPSSRPESREQRMRREAWGRAGQLPPTDDDLDAAAARDAPEDDPSARADTSRRGRRRGGLIPHSLPDPVRLLGSVIDILRGPEPPAGSDPHPDPHPDPDPDPHPDDTPPGRETHPARQPPSSEEHDDLEPWARWDDAPPRR